MRILYWSHGANEWMFYREFKTVTEFEKHLINKGYDPRLFKEDK